MLPLRRRFVLRCSAWRARWAAALLAAALLAVAGGTRPARAQDATAVLTGTVRDAVTGATLPQANVRLAPADLAPAEADAAGADAAGRLTRGVAADSLGAFRLAGLTPGRYVVTATYVGYEPARQAVTLAPGAARRVTLRLAPADVAVEGVVVTADRVREDALGVDRLDPDAIRDLPTVLEPDIFRSLQLLPGVKAASDFSSGLYIRGGSPDQTLVLLDRATVYNPTHVFGFFSTFNPDAIGDVLLYKGGYPAPYGGRLGSVVALSSRRGTDAVQGQASLGLLSARGYLAGPFARRADGTARGGWMVAARRSTLEPLLSTLNALEVDDIPRSFAFYDLNAALRYDLTRRDRLRLSAYAGRDALDFPFLGAAVLDVTYGNEAASAAWQHTFGERAVATLGGGLSRYRATPEADISGTLFRRDATVSDASADLDATVYAGAHTLAGGLRLGSFLTRLTNEVDDETRYDPRTRTGYAAAYLQDTYAPAPAWTVTAGLRASRFAADGVVRLAPRLTLEHALTDALRLQAGYGRYYQALSLFSSQLFSAFDFWLTSDAGVAPSFGDQVVLGLKAAPRPGWRLEVEGYARTMRDLFELDRRIADYTGLDFEETLLFGRGLAYGVETLVRGERGPVGGFVAYTLSRTTRTFDAFEGGRTFPTRYDRTHDLNVVARYDFADAWRATAVFTYATGQAFTDPNGYFRLYDARFASGVTLDGLISSFNAARLPAYHRLDVGVRRVGAFLWGTRYELQMQLLNVYSRRNVWFYFFDADVDNRIARTVVPQIPIPIPNVALTVRF